MVARTRPWIKPVRDSFGRGRGHDRRNRHEYTVANVHHPSKVDQLEFKVLGQEVRINVV